MKITIDGSEYSIVFEEGQFAVHIGEFVFQAATVTQLLEDLRKYYEVVLPETIYANDLTLLGELVQAGFKYLHVNKICIGPHFAELTVSHWSPNEMERVTEEWQKKGLRYYEARWTDENGHEQVQQYTEATLEALGKVYVERQVEKS